MTLFRRLAAPLVRLAVIVALAGLGCSDPSPGGVIPTSVRRIEVETPRDLTEASAAVITRSQPGIVFTINDSGHDAELFAIDTTGRPRGRWRVLNELDVDWEAAAAGPCPVSGAASADSIAAASAAANGHAPGCLTIADVGDNQERRPARLLLRVAEPLALTQGDTGTLTAERLQFHYEDGPHDVEAMVVGPRGDTYLFTKRPRADADGKPRPSLVFELSASAWGGDTLVVARIVDSLPIVPGSAAGRTITDASLSPDGHFVAVRTYTEVYIFVADLVTGRPRTDRPVTQCNVSSIERKLGEGVAWIGTQRELLLTQEGRSAPFFAITCPLPDR